jgi:putative flippase GtrA
VAGEGLAEEAGVTRSSGDCCPDGLQGEPNESTAAGEAIDMRARTRRLTWAKTLQVRRFAAVGVVNTLVDYVLFVALTKLFRIPLDWVWIAKVASGTVAISISFYLNRTWVFRSGRARLGQAARFIAATFVGVYVIQTSLTQFFVSYRPGLGEALYAFLDDVGLAGVFPVVLTEPLAIKTVAFVLATSVSMTFNFLAYRFWVFPAESDRVRLRLRRHRPESHDESNDSLRDQGMRFLLAGGAMAIFYLGLTSLLTLAGVPFQLALILGFAANVALHFTLQRVFVWPQRREYALAWHEQLRRYLPLVIVQYVLTVAATATLPGRLGLSVLVVFVGITVSFTVFNFLFFRVRIFHVH